MPPCCSTGTCPDTWHHLAQALVMCWVHLCKQTCLSHENRAKGAWSRSLSCVSDGEGMKDSEDNTSKEHLPHMSSSSISDGPGKEGQAAGWIFGPAKPDLNSWIEMIHSPALWQRTSIICTAFSLNLPHAKPPNLDIWYIFYQLKVLMCWGCSAAPVQDWRHQLRTLLSPGPNLHWHCIQASFSVLANNLVLLQFIRIFLVA